VSGIGKLDSRKKETEKIIKMLSRQSRKESVCS